MSKRAFEKQTIEYSSSSCAGRRGADHREGGAAKRRPILILMISAMLFVAAILGAMAFGSLAAEGGAATASEPRIISKNISYDAELHTCYAVPCDSIAAGQSVKLCIMDSNGETIAEVTDYRIESVFGTSCYVFIGLGTSPRNIGVTEYVKAVSSDGKESATVEYSVLEYLCHKLTTEKYLERTEADGKEYTRRSLYLQLLKYSESAQALLGSASSIKLSELCYLGGDGVSTAGVAANGSTVSLSYNLAETPLYREFIGWSISRYDIRGNYIDSFTAENGDELEIGGFVCATPRFTTNLPEGITAFYSDSKVAISISSEELLYGEYATAEKIADVLDRSVGSVEIIFGKPTADFDTVIYLGNCDSAASRAAYASLSEVRSARMYSEAKAVISAMSGEIAIAYDPNKYTDLQSLDIAAELLCNKLKVDQGSIFIEDFTEIEEIDLIAIQKESDLADEAREWEELLALAVSKYGEAQGEELVAEIREYYSLRSDNLIVWYANLYDPGIGGFYAANSGKKYAGFMPMLETTGQLLGHLADYGVFSCKGGSSKKALPEHIKAQIIYYLKSCQDPVSGYFYNPQLGKALSDQTVVRRGRDLSRVTSQLSSLGSAPTYNAPNGTRGDGITADEYWASTGLPDELKPYVPSSLEEYESYLKSITASLGASTAEAVACLVATASLTAEESDSSEEYLASHANFAAYLDSKNIDANPYSVGNEFNGTYRLIKVASDRIGAYASPEGTAELPWYEGMTLCNMLIDFMTRHINSKGLFGTIPEDSTDELDGIRFANANGFFKMITIYNAWGVEYPEPMKAAKALLTSIKGDEPSTGNVCNVYNSWNALSSLMSNVKKTYADSPITPEEKAAVLAYINDALGADGPAAITNTYVKQSAYACADGTFSNSVSSSVSSFPGGLLAGLGVKEGNVDAIGFGLCATMNSIYSVMGLSSEKVAYYREYHYLIFLEEILNVKPVTEKVYCDVNDKDYVTDYENYNSDEFIRIVTLVKGDEKNSLEFVKEGENTVIEATKVSGTVAVTVGQYTTYEESGANKLVYGASIKVVSLKKNAQIQFTIGSSSTSPFLVLLSTRSTSANAALSVNCSTGAISSKVGEWFDIRIEYQITARDETGKATAFLAEAYINNVLVFQTTDMYNTQSTRRILELDEFDKLTVSFNQPNDGVFRVDNTYMHKINTSLAA